MEGEHVTTNHMKLVERVSGIGKLTIEGQLFGNVRYEICRYQGMARSGLPIPGLHRIEGNVDLAQVPESVERTGRDSTLELEDGRTLRLAIASDDGRVLNEGHGPSRCSCC